eukprot:441905-Hanusia_phi.AAC.6
MAVEETAKRTIQCTHSSRNCIRVLTQTSFSQEAFDSLITGLEKLYDDELKLQDAFQREEDLADNDKIKAFQREMKAAGADASSLESCYKDCVKLVRQIFNVAQMKSALSLNDDLRIDRRLERKILSSTT